MAAAVPEPFATSRVQEFRKAIRKFSLPRKEKEGAVSRPPGALPR